jgi:hypothetical protein
MATVEEINKMLEETYERTVGLADITLTRADQVMRILVVRRGSLASKVLDSTALDVIEDGALGESVEGRLVTDYPKAPPYARVVADPPSKAAADYVAAVREAYRLRDVRRSAPAEATVEVIAE